jgi:Phage integrase family
VAVPGGLVVCDRTLHRRGHEGYRRIRFHDLRHTCASLLLAQNVPARVAMEILGHSQLAMTTDLYSHVMPTASREAADAIDRVSSSRTESRCARHRFPHVTPKTSSREFEIYHSCAKTATD